MTRLGMLVCVLFFGIGCACEGPKEQWAIFKKDMSDDIILKSDFTQTREPSDSTAPTKPRNGSP
jgi:hypothetical protein